MSFAAKFLANTNKEWIALKHRRYKEIFDLDPDMRDPLATTRPEPFRLDPTNFVHRARQMRPTHAQPTASGFSQRVYSLYSNAWGDEDDRDLGKLAEHDIQRMLATRRREVGRVTNDFLAQSQLPWRLVHNGMNANNHAAQAHLTVNDLRVGGEPLRVSPDLVYRNTEASEVVILEAKHTKMPVPTNLWPNIWAQLWCYAQIDIARQAETLTVIGEVWGNSPTRQSKRHSGLVLRASVRRNPRHPPFDRFFRTLFDIYRGCG